MNADTAYIVPMRLWSTVVTQLQMPDFATGRGKIFGNGVTAGAPVVNIRLPVDQDRLRDCLFWRQRAALRIYFSVLMYAIKSSICCDDSFDPKFSGITPLENPFTIFAFGSTMDCFRYASSAVTVLPSLSVT